MMGRLFRRVARMGSLPPLLLLLVVLLYGAWTNLAPKPPPQPDGTWTRIQKEGVVRIGIDPSFPPFETDDGKGNLTGFDIALASSLAARWGVRVQYVYTGFDGLYDALTGNQFDMVLSALPYNPQKTQDVLFSHSYFDGGPMLVVPAGDNTTWGITSLANRAVAVEMGTSGDVFARRWQRRLKLDLREFDTTQEALRAVGSGAAAAAIVDPISFYDFRRANPSISLKMVGKPLDSELYIIAVRRDSPTLRDQIDAAIDSMLRDGSLNDLQKKWF